VPTLYEISYPEPPHECQPESGCQAYSAALFFQKVSFVEISDFALRLKINKNHP
jgi:hypothetical protein